MSGRKSIPTPWLIAVVFVFGYLAGNAGPMVAWAKKSNVYEKLDVFAKVLHYVENNYVEEVDQKELIYGAIKGMLDTLDPHTIFMPPDLFREMKIDTTGEFQGLGIRVQSVDQRLVVIEPLEGAPARKAGILSGDVILAIDGRDLRGVTLQDAVTLMRGPIGTQVVLSIYREGFEAPKDFTLIRDRIRTSSVDFRLLDGNDGYIRVRAFQDRTAGQMTAAIEKLKAEADGRLEGLILDLRGNPGGLLDEAVKMVDEFVAEGKIVSTIGRNRGHIEVERAHKSGIFLKGKLVLLIDSGSASAAEIVAGALQDHGRAVLVGVNSFGKGSVQNIIDLDDGSGLKITVARYYTPSDRSIDSIGIKPDITVVQPEVLAQLARSEAEEMDLRSVESTDERGMKLLESVPPPKGMEPTDMQLRAAYAYLCAGEKG